MTNVQDDFDLDSLTLKQDFSAAIGVQKVLTHVPVRKPNKTDFIRVRPEPEYTRDFGIVELKDAGETYIITGGMMSEPGVFELVVPVRLVTTITRQNTIGLWPLKLPKEEGRENPWHSSALEAAQMAMAKWVRIAPDMSLGAYQVYEATANLPDPEWPDHSFSELVQRGFKGKIVDSPDHPLIDALLGAK